MEWECCYFAYLFAIVCGCRISIALIASCVFICGSAWLACHSIRSCHLKTLANKTNMTNVAFLLSNVPHLLVVFFLRMLRFCLCVNFSFTQVPLPLKSLFFFSNLCPFYPGGCFFLSLSVGQTGNTPPAMADMTELPGLSGTISAKLVPCDTAGGLPKANCANWQAPIL